ncbi:MAG TPA: histidine kinase [Bryobacteraceae bacterium]
MAFACFLSLASPIRALTADRTIEQYVHSAWGREEGYSGGAVYGIAQSTDGYLWLATEHGLWRFDGFEFTQVELGLFDRPADGAIRAVVQDSEGNLWIRLDGPRLIRYRDGVFEDAISKFDISEAFFTATSRNDAGNFLAWGPQNRSLRFAGGRFQPILQRDRTEGIVISMLETANGTVWLGTRDAGLRRIEHGVNEQIVSDTKLQSVNALAPSEGGGVWIGSENGLHLWEKGEVSDVSLAVRPRKTQIFSLVRDHHHNLWVGTDDGLFRIDPRQRIVTGVYRDNEDPTVSSIYEDAEGSIWFAGSRRVERLRDGMFTSFSGSNVSLKEIGGPLYVDDSGKTWFAPISGGLFTLEGGVAKRVAVPELGNDVIYSISGSKQELWLGRQQGGLTRLEFYDDHWVTHTYTTNDGLAQNSVYTVSRTRDGTVWAGTVSGGVSVLRNGQIKTYTVDDGLPSNAIFSSLEGADGKMWFASPEGLVSFEAGRWTTFTPAESDPPLNIRTVFEDLNHELWIGTSHGLAFLDHGQIQVPRNVPRVLKEEVLGITQDAHGFLWLATAEHVLQINLIKLVNRTLTDRDVLIYGADDGLLETRGVRRDRSVIAGRQGRIWFSLLNSVAFANPEDAEGYLRPVRVRIEPPSSESSYTTPSDGSGLSADTRSVTFQFAASTMLMPQRTQFRYRLDGSGDSSWSYGSSSRRVVFTHLSPGNYRFRIMASNALGMWNGPESQIAFSIRPAYWQTWYFQLLIAASMAGLAVVLYRLRMMKVKSHLNRRFQDRIAERTRIAQELHDTLLQGVISASMQLDVAQDHLPEESHVKGVLARVLEQMRQVIAEGRQSLRGLRTIDSSLGIEVALKGVTTESPASNVEVSVHVYGNQRQLKDPVFDEIYRIGREAYINAIAHSGARQIKISIEYGLRNFHLTVTDDGCGIDTDTLERGREGHWGIAGMRERARSIGSVLEISSRAAGGTSVDLKVPSTIAYAASRRKSITWLSRIRKHNPNS